MCNSEHAEKEMIAKLKTESGYSWTNKLEGMFKDVALSAELQNKFKGIYDTEKEDSMALEVNVCTTSYWPAAKKVNFRMPNEILAAAERYKKFYLNEHSGHKVCM